MTVPNISTSKPLLTRLEANGLSADKAKLVGSDLAAAVKSAALEMGSTATTSASVRAALDAKIAADVASGKLTQGDAAVVKKTLDGIDGQSGGSGITSQAAPAAAASADAAGSAAAAGGQGRGDGDGGGGGGGGGSSKTERSETVTVVGSTKTTVITYTDDTTSTSTTTATDADIAKYAKASVAAAMPDVAGSYLSTIEAGTLFSQTA